VTVTSCSWPSSMLCNLECRRIWMFVLLKYIDNGIPWPSEWNLLTRQSIYSTVLTSTEPSWKHLWWSAVADLLGWKRCMSCLPLESHVDSAVYGPNVLHSNRTSECIPHYHGWLRETTSKHFGAVKTFTKSFTRHTINDHITGMRKHFVRTFKHSYIHWK
jgi:hypothetical protein